MSQQTPDAPHVVRRFEPRDVPTIKEILSESPEAAAWSTASLEQLHASNSQSWVAENNGEIVAFLAARVVAPDEAEILNLAVAESSRRIGAATSLLSVAIAELTRGQVRRVHLEVRESNHAGISLYEKNGFTRTGRRPNYYRNPEEAAVLLVRELTA
jgi:[ribosomal protein S18]-alanine N-acetyltransferase